MPTLTRRRDQRGFTLIELLVVMIVIGIIAGIAIPVFMNQKAKAHDAAVKSQAPSVAKAVETAFSDATGAVTGTSQTSQVTVGTATQTVSTSSGVQWSVDGDSTSGYCIAVWSTDASKYTSSKPLFYDSTKGGILPDTATGCAHGSPDLSFAAGGGAATPSGFTQLWGLNSQGFCGLLNTNVYCWGGVQPYGQGGVTGATPTAVNVAAGVNPASLNWGVNNACYISSGDAYCMGRNWYGELGNGVTDYWGSLTPVPVSMTGALAGKKWSAITTDTYDTCGITTDGATYCWGRGMNGVIPGHEGTTVTLPTQVVGTEAIHAAKIALIGGAAACILSDTGAPTCWSSYGGLFTPATGGLTFTDVHPVSGGACLLATDKHVYCYGMANWGETGTGVSGAWTTTPTPVSGTLATLTVEKLTGACAATTDKRVFCWNSALGIPQDVSGPLAGKTITAAAGAGSTGAAFTTSDGTTWTVNMGGVASQVPSPAP